MQKQSGFVERLFSGTAALSCFAMMCLTTADAFGRYFLQPIVGAYEIAEQYLMVAVVYLATSIAYKEGACIRVTFLFDRLPKRPRVVIAYFVQAFSALVCLLIVLGSFRHALKMFNKRELMQTIDVIVWPAYFLVPIGLLPTFLKMAYDITRVKTGRSCLFGENTPEGLNPESGAAEGGR